jgi:NitT/TauT family transport system substrate-binding protein
VWVAVVAVAVIAVMSGCGSSGGSSSSSTTKAASSDKVDATLKMGSLKIANSAPQVVDPSIFTKQGITLDISYATSGAAIVPGVIGGSYDVGYGSVVSVVQAVQQGLPIKIIANGDISVGDVIVKADSGITDAKGLEGKSVATNALKSTVDLETSVSVDERGGDASKLKFIEIPFPAQLAALDSGSIDAAVLPEPFLSQAKANPKYKDLFSIFDVKPKDLTNCYFASESFLKSNAQAAKQFVAGIREANEYATANPQAARTAVSTVTGAPPPAVANIELPTWLSGKVDSAGISVVVDRMVKFGLIDDAPPAKSIVWSESS